MNAAEFDEMYALATKRGKELEKLDKKNALRRAKGRPQLLSDSEKADLAVKKRKYKTKDPTTVTSEEALKLFSMRKARMAEGEPSDDMDDEVEYNDSLPKTSPGPKTNNPIPSDVDRAIREAEAVRKVEDLKNGRINHAGVWSDGNRLEGGDQTHLLDITKHDQTNEGEKTKKNVSKNPKNPNYVSSTELDEFKNDLYGRLKISFEELEKTLSDLQGRVSEIVTASTPVNEVESKENDDSDMDKFLESRTPITFDVHGTKMTCDAVRVFYNSPCITILSRLNSATIQPEAGARLRLSYEVDGRKFIDDPVTFVGLRVDIAELGFSLVGFVRDIETDLVPVKE